MIDNYEERGKWSTRQSWVFIFILAGFLLGWGMLMMTLIKDVPREWDFGNVEFTPAKSIYSTNNPKVKTSEKMTAPLPDGISMEEENIQTKKQP